jgi:hypothetical protein
MLDLLKRAFRRRDLFQGAGILGLSAMAPSPATPAPTAGLQLGKDIYSSIGVRPVINCRGTLTVIGGSAELPEVRAAKDIANQQFVVLDELMDAIGKRLSELTGAEWGMVSSGCAAAMSHATAACVAGGNPDLHVRIPNLEGFAKDEVIIPAHSRNVYDAAIRAVGVKIIEVSSKEQARGGDWSEDRDDLYVRDAAGGDRVAHVRRRDQDRQSARRANNDRCRAGDSDDPLRIPATGRDAGRLQRRQGDTRTAKRWVAAGT